VYKIFDIKTLQSLVLDYDVLESVCSVLVLSKVWRAGGDVFLCSCMIFTLVRQGCTVVRRMAARWSIARGVQATARVSGAWIPGRRRRVSVIPVCVVTTVMNVCACCLLISLPRDIFWEPVSETLHHQLFLWTNFSWRLRPAVVTVCCITVI